MILSCQNDISTRQAEADLTLQLHGEVNFHPDKVAQVSSWYLLF